MGMIIRFAMVEGNTAEKKQKQSMNENTQILIFEFECWSSNSRKFGSDSAG
jgi:hypothetical protein